MVSRESLTAWASLHIAELVVLPVAAICAVTSWAYVLWLAFMPEAGTSVVLGLLALVSTTVAGTVLVASLRLPLSLHAAGVAVLVSVSLSGMGQGSPFRIALLGLTWLAALFLGSTVAGATPFHGALPKGESEVFAERVGELSTEWHIYAPKRSLWRRKAGYRRGTLLLASALIGWLVAGGFGLTSIKSQLSFALASGVLFGSLLVLTALLGLHQRKVEWERENGLYIDAACSRPWPRTVLLCALVVVVAAVLLPADVSPLHAIDWNAVMSDFTVRLFSRVRMGRGGSMDGLQSWSVDSATPITGFAPGHRVQLFPMLYAVVAVGTVAYVLWRLVGLLLEVDLERRRGVWTVLRFVLQLPILLVRLLIDRLFARIAGQAQVSSSRRTHQSPRAKSNGGPGQTGSARAATVRRLFVLLLLWAKEQGAPRTATQTAAEFARVLAGRFPTVADDIAYVTDVYQSVRYSADRDDTPSPERMRASVRRIVTERDN